MWSVVLAVALALAQVVVKLIARPDRIPQGRYPHGRLARVPLGREDFVFWPEWLVLGLTSLGFAILASARHSLPNLQSLLALALAGVGVLLAFPLAVRFFVYDSDGELTSYSVRGRQVKSEWLANGAAIFLLVLLLETGVQIYEV